LLTLRAMLKRFSVAVPVLESVTVWEALAMPTV
jgi:hypothetical protein